MVQPAAVVEGFLRGNCGMSSLAGKVLRRLAAEIREFRRWEKLCDPSDIRVYYGMDVLPWRGETVSGGIVKCLDLAERYPNVAANPNLLYLVSSVLPDRRELLTRAAKRARARVVLNQNGVAYPAWAGPLWREQNVPNAYVHARADYVIYQSKFCQRCAERFLGGRTGPSQVLYNPVDIETFVPRPDYNCAGRSPVLLAAGSHHDSYRVRIALTALAMVRRRGIDTRLLLAGRLVWGNEAEKELHQWISDENLSGFVEYLGPYTQAEAPRLFQRADILLHMKVQDPCPRLVVEAMACGVPVVYSATGGTPELVGDEGGTGIPCAEDFETMHAPPDEAVAEGILRILSSREIYARQARARAVRLFSAQEWTDRHAGIFQSLAGG